MLKFGRRRAESPRSLGGPLLWLPPVILLIAGAIAARALFPTTDSAPDGPDAPPAIADPQPAARDFQGLHRDQLACVEDDTITRRRIEHPAWFHLFSLLQNASLGEMEQASLGRTGYLQLHAQPEVYRGSVVTLTGTARRAHWLTAPENGEGIEGYCEIYLQPDDRPDVPIILYSLTTPEGFPTGMSIDEPVRVHGFSFKRASYVAHRQARLAPVVLSKGIAWRPPSGGEEIVGQAEDGRLKKILGVIGACVVVAFGALVVLLLKRRPPSSREPLPEQLDWDVPPIDPEH